MVKKASQPIVLGLFAALWLIGPPQPGPAQAMMSPLDGLAPYSRPLLQGIAEKKSTSTVKKSATTPRAPKKTAIPKKAAAPKKTTAPKSSSTTQPRTTQPSLPKKTTTPAKKPPSKTGKPPPAPRTGDVIVKERLPSKPGKTEEATPLPELSDAEASGGTMTTQAVTEEELEQLAEDNPDQVTDHDGDGDYEKPIELYEDSVVTVEGDYAQVDVDGDGQVDYMIPAENWDPETNTVYAPTSPETVDLGEDPFNPDLTWDDVYSEAGYVELDLDGDGESELYASYDTDGDGYADIVNTHSDPDSYPSGDYRVIPLPPEEQTDPGEPTDPGGEHQGGVSISVTIAPSASPDYVEPEDTAAAEGSDELVQNLTDLKSLFNEGILSQAEYETAQYRALASVDPAATGVEDGLKLLRDLWDQELISETPYGGKRQEMLDAL